MCEAEISFRLAPKIRSKPVLLKISHIRVIIEIIVQQNLDNFLKRSRFRTADSRHDTDLDSIFAPVLDLKIVETLCSVLSTEETAILLDNRFQLLADTKLRTDKRSPVSEKLL